MTTEPRAASATVEAISREAACVRLRALTTLSTHEVFFVTSTDGLTMKNCFISQSVVKQLGFRAEDIFDKQVPLEACVHPSDIERLRAAIAAHTVACQERTTRGDPCTTSTFELQTFLYRRRRRDGTWADLELAGFVELAPHAPDVALVYGIGRDVSANVAAETALKDLLLSSSFDLRINAQNILAATALLGERPAIKGDEEALFLAQMLHSSSNLLHNQVSGVIEMRKLERGEVTIRSESFCIRTLVADVMQMCRLSVQCPAAAVVWADEAEIRALPDVVEGDGQHMSQIVQNLIQNSLRFCAGSTVRVRATLERPGNGRPPTATMLRVDVSDEGVGLTAEECLRVFLAFEKAPVSEGGGTGLGLYTSRALARLLGGDLTVVSRKGQGSTFTMRIPVRVLGLGGDPAGAGLAIAPRLASPPLAPAYGPVALGAPALPSAESDLIHTMLERLMEHASDVFAVLDPLPGEPSGPESMRISFVSPNVQRVLGWQAADLIGRQGTDFMFAQDIAMHTTALQELFSGALSSVQGVRRMVCKDGSLRWMHVDMCVDDAGGLLCVARDATRHEAKQKALQEFLLSTSHDLRTPCHSILTGTQLLSQRECILGDADALFLIDAVKASCALLLGTITNVLDMRAIDSQELGARLSSVAPESFSPAQLAAEVLHTVCLGSGRSSAAIDWTPPTSPPLPERAEANVSRVQQCLQNMLVIALTHATTGKPHLTITCEPGSDPAALAELQARVVFQSTSMECSSEEDCQRVFSPLATGLPAGVGLFSAQAYARAMGGDLVLAPAAELPDAKSFTLRLPVRLPTAGAKAPSPPMRPAPGEAAGGSPRSQQNPAIRRRLSPAPSPPPSLPRCLLVEDHILNRKLVVRLLESQGFQVDAACDGVEALQMLQASFSGAPGASPPPDLLLTDLSMPRMGGLELAQQFRAFERSSLPADAHLPIVALTAHVLDSCMEECYAAGCDAHLSKPLRADSIALLRTHIKPQRSCS